MLNNTFNFLLGARYDIDIFIEGYEWLGELWYILDLLVMPIIIIVATAAIILLTVLGVKAARAETPDKRHNQKVLIKKIIIGVSIGLVLLVAIYVFNLFLPQIVHNITKDLIVEEDTLLNMFM